MTLRFSALCSELWAISPDWLHVLAAFAIGDRELGSSLGWQQHGAFDDKPDVKPPTPAERYAALVGGVIGAAVRDLPNQGSGRAVVAENVAIIPITGPIFPRANMMTKMSGATTTTELQRDVQAALNDGGVDSLLYVVDSPGGAVSGVATAGDFIFNARRQKPSASHVTATGASAAYWLASQAERMTLERTASVGSIGVVAALPKQVAPDQRGTRMIEIVSSNAENKRPDPETPEGVLAIREQLDAIEAHFINDVARARGVSAETVRANFKRGGMAPDAEAKALGMVDAVSGFDAALRHMARVGKASRAGRG